MPWPRRPSAARADAARRRRDEAGGNPTSGSSRPDEIGTRLAASSDRDEALPCESPVFICASGWRSGSTLLQRMCMADPTVMVWGEPLDRCGILQSLAAQWRPLDGRWPNPRHVLAPDRKPPGVDEWIANLSPPIAALRHAQRRFLDTLFGEPARAAGRTRWGLKEVRLGLEEIRWLAALFPDARFALLVRDPVAAFESYAPRGPWFERWPDGPVTTATAFASMWSRLVAGFLELVEDPRVMLVRYERLESRCEALALHLDLHLDLNLDRDLAAPSSLERIVGHATIHEDRRATASELRTVRRHTADLLARVDAVAG